jgi:hypothetical protein
MSVTREPPVPGVSRLSPIAHNGSSSVYRGYQERFDRWVAVKVLHVDPGRGMDATARRRFERECAVTGHLSDHPHVVRIYDCGILADGRPYLVTELCEQGSVADRLARAGAMPADEVVDIGMKIADALHAAHEAGIIHRDVKPANVLLRSGGEPALADFGLSVRVNRDASRGLDAFSPAYAPPESLADGTYSAAGDVYSLGSTLYTLLAGRPPVPFEPGEAPLPYIQRVLRQPIAPIDRSDAAAEVSEAVFAMLARRPEDRPSAGEVTRRLESLRAAAAAPPAAVGKGLLDDTSARRELVSETQVRSPATPARKRIRPPHLGSKPARRAALVAAVVAALVAVTAAAVAYAPSLPGLARAELSDPAPAQPSPGRSEDPMPPTGESMPEPSVPDAYHEVDGPEGLVVAIPDGWVVGPAAAHHNRKATDPHDPERFVLFGGEAADEQSQLDRVAELATQLPDYRPIALRQVEYGDAEDAVDWEAAFTLDGQAVRAHGRYWRIDGREYAVYSRAREDDVEEMEETFDVMVETARPR